MTDTCALSLRPDARGPAAERPDADTLVSTLYADNAPFLACIRHRIAEGPVPGRGRRAGDDAAGVAALRGARRRKGLGSGLADEGGAQHRDGQDPHAALAARRGR